MGILVKNSGFEDIVYQAGVCSTGSLNGVFSGSLYNKAWFVHEIVSEALERLLMKRFLQEVKPEISENLNEIVTEPETRQFWRSTVRC